MCVCVCVCCLRRTQSTSDAALETLGALLEGAAGGSRAAAIGSFKLQHVVLRPRGHAWLCESCMRSPAVAAARADAAAAEATHKP